ncbi:MULTISPECIES: phosphoribosyltransferase domain-containing protein [Planococcus]|uniref:Adenine/guanine phosphoribosyltransferase n=2 Tax=Planococcus faecalis TaxID=1598147 RepID=A0ABM6IVC7_9BACL|nr:MULTISPECIES: phosphoribosyltransferase domain-containing protein [Planococcus]AQU80516.1 adenine/guanine phosphoribosyltransferase [Planococcus faecalis]MDJ0330193.1 phosphoribosyltransferase domain-containing protein [Planococcus sp. S3-L1]
MNISVTYAYQGLSAESLFSVALRVNKNRQFLFVSKLIAKHLAVHPSLALGTGTLLASLLMEEVGVGGYPETPALVKMIETGVVNRDITLQSLEFKKTMPQKTVFIGMAETATGLGHSVFQHFEESAYIHTTREEITGITPSFVFEEEHSHATSHKVYAPSGMLEQAETIVLIDDEISTGNTLLNLVCALDDQFPGKNYVSLSILDWRSDSQKEKIEKIMAERQIDLKVLSLMTGQFELLHSTAPTEPEMSLLSGVGHRTPHTELGSEKLTIGSKTGQRYISQTGRFGLTSEQHDEIGSWAKTAVEKLVSVSDKALVIGVGENMYLPLRFALALEGNALVQTTTRSPIFASPMADYPIKEKVKFELPDAFGVSQFIYNLNEVEIDRIYLIAESVIALSDWQPLLTYLEKKAPVEWISLTTTKRSEEIE